MTATPTDDLLIAFGLAQQGQNDPKPFNYGNMMVSFMGGQVHFFNVAGDTSYGGYRLPPDNQTFLNFLDKMSEKVEYLEDNLMYMCSKCGKDFDLPAFKTDENGQKICRGCVTGQQVPDELPETDALKKAKAEGKIDKKVTPEELKNIRSATKYLEKRGYVVKKLIASYRVAYLDEGGEARISKEYFKSEEEFTKAMPEGVTFLNLITKLKQEEEVMDL